MNEIVKAGATGLSGTRQLQATLLQPGRECAKFLRAVEDLHGREHNPFPTVDEIWSRSDVNGVEESLVRLQRRARRWLQQAPKPQVLAKNLATFDEALATSGDRATLEIIIAALFDGFPNARLASPEGCIEATAILIEEEPSETGESVSIYAVAAAVPRIWRASKFAPTPGEVLESYRECRAQLTYSKRIAEEMIKEYRKAEGIVGINIEDFRADGMQKREASMKNIEARRQLKASSNIEPESL